MKKKLFVHIGMPKAGSTALQEFLYMNREVLEDMGLLYPDPRQLEQFSRKPQMMKGHHIVPMYLTGFFWAHFPKKNGITSDQIFTFIRNQISASPAQKVLLSSEACWFMLNRPDVVKEFVNAFSDFDLKIIAYLRRQDDHIQSGYNECIKSSFYTMNVDEFIEDRFLDPSNKYYSHLMLWVNTIGYNNITVRIYEKRCLINGSIFDDLLAQCGIELNKELKLPKKDANPRLSLDALIFQRIVNIICADKAVKQEFSSLLLAYSESNDRETTRAFGISNLLDQKQRDRINKWYSEENELLSSVFLTQSQKEAYQQSKTSGGSGNQHLSSEKIYEITNYIENQNPDLINILFLQLNQPGNRLITDISYYRVLKNTIESCLLKRNLI